MALLPTPTGSKSPDSIQSQPTNATNAMTIVFNAPIRTSLQLSGYPDSEKSPRVFHLSLLPRSIHAAHNWAGRRETSHLSRPVRSYAVFTLGFPKRRYRLGTTNKLSSVEVTRPPRMTMAMGCSIS